jgi:hypothetical protein
MSTTSDDRVPSPSPGHDKGLGSLLRRALSEGGIRLGLRRPPRFALHRILGNDLPPRHSAGQTLTNVRFILDNEPAFANCTKHWVLNRITDAAVEADLVALLTERGQDFFRIPFEPDAYAACGWDVEALLDEDFLAALGEDEGEHNWRIAYRMRLAKNLYAMNNNGARNAAFDHGRAIADVVLPFDGNIFLTEEAFAGLAEAVRHDPRLRYLIVPMARIGDQPEQLLTEGIPRDATEEPQIALHRLALGRFDDRLGYGLRPKVDLLTRLNVDHPTVMGPLDRWDLTALPSPEDHARHRIVSRVARLPSGTPGLEVGDAARVDRWRARNAGIIDKLDGLDRALIAERYDGGPVIFDMAVLECLSAAAPGTAAGALRARIIASAEEAVLRGTMSVLDKTAVAASGDPHDYHSRAPYFWPDPGRDGGFPYVRRDGERVAEARLGHPAAEAFDRDRLRHMFAGAVSGALAGAVTGLALYSDFAAACVRRWFLDPVTAMNPHFAYAQVRPGHDGDRGQGSGLIEWRRVGALLDAIRLLERSGHLSAGEIEALRTWFSAFAAWMRSSPEGKVARVSHNNIGTYYDTEMLAMSLFTGDFGEVSRCFRRLSVRAKMQFADDGGQPAEEARTLPVHYAIFNLLGWAEADTVARRLRLESQLACRAKRRAAVDVALAAAQSEDAAVDPSLVRILSVLRQVDRGHPIAEPSDILVASEDCTHFWALADMRILAAAERG